MINSNFLVLHSTISDNTFTGLSLNTTGDINLIYNSHNSAANGSKTVQNNQVIGSLSRSAGGANDFFGYFDFGNSPNTVSHIISGNNFSNINNGTSTGNFYGIDSEDGAGTPSLNVFNNTVSNITTSGSSNVGGIFINHFAGTVTVPNEVYGNTVSNFTLGNVTNNIYGLYIGQNANYLNVRNNIINNISTSGNAMVLGLYLNVSTAAATINTYGNSIHSILSTGTGTINGMWFNSTAANLTVNAYRNKIYNISGSNAASIASGIRVTICPATLNLYNNFIGDIRATAANSANSAVNGIYSTAANAASTMNIFYNTIYLAAPSTAGNFSSSGIFHTTNATATIAALNLRNNIIVNNSTPSGTGIAAAYRRSSAVLTNYATSNNNLFYAGTPSTNRLLYYDGTNSSQTLAQMQAIAGFLPRESASVTEDPPFVNRIDPTQANYLHFDNVCSGTPTQVESGGTSIPSITNDYDIIDLRWGAVGYAGGGSAPDIGADEFGSDAIEVTTIPPTGTFYYSTLKAAFDKINDGTHQGAITIRVLCSTIEPVSAILNASGGSNPYTSVLIYPAFTGLSIGGDIDGASLIELNGADHVTIDGRVNQTGIIPDLVIENTSISNSNITSTIRLQADATNNLITYCNVNGSGSSDALQTGATIWIAAASTLTGNSLNTVSECNIGPANANLPSKAIYLSGLLLVPNTGNQILNNNIFDYFHASARSAGVRIENGTNELSSVVIVSIRLQPGHRQPVSSIPPSGLPTLQGIITR